IASKVFGWVWAMLFPDGRWMDAFHGHSLTVCIRSTALQPSWKNRGLGRRHADHKISLFLLICSTRGAQAQHRAGPVIEQVEFAGGVLADGADGEIVVQPQRLRPIAARGLH